MCLGFFLDVTYCESVSVLCSGFFFEPTLFTGVQDHMYIAVEESFGPVMIVSSFSGGCVHVFITLYAVNATLASTNLYTFITYLLL